MRFSISPEPRLTAGGWRREEYFAAFGMEKF
jgi:hypothetical protein